MSGGAPAFFGHMGVAIALGFASKIPLGHKLDLQIWVQPTELLSQASVFRPWEY